VISLHPTKNWWEAKKLQLTWHPSQGQQNLFFQPIIHFTIFTAIILGFGACLA